MPRCCKNSVNWIYRLDKNFEWESGLTFDKDYVYFDKDGTVRLIIEDNGKITITEGYTWNGCSPKICILDLFIFGTPDGVLNKKTGKPKTYYATLLHDALYQFLRVNSPFSRLQADGIFLLKMKESDFCLRYFYWVAVRVFGWLVWSGKQLKRKWKGKDFHPLEFWDL